MEQFDVIVVGLGAVGSAATYQLARRGRRVVGIDRFDPPHQFGSSHGGTRITRFSNLEGPHYVPLVVRSHEIWNELEHETGRDLLTITGGLVIGNPPATAEDRGLVAGFSDAARVNAVGHEVLSADEIRRRFPRFLLRGDEEGYYEPGAGYLRPEACIRAQLDMAVRFGAQLRLNERVVNITPTSSVVTVDTTAGRLGADHVIVAAGPWIGEWLPAGLRPRLNVFRQVLYWFDLDVDPGLFMVPHFPVFVWQVGNDAHQMFYGFPATDGPSGGVKIATEQYAIATTADDVQRTVSPDEAADMARLNGSRIQGVSARLLRAESCMYSVVEDWHYMVGALPGADRVLMASACMGRGFKHSAALGESLAQLATTGQSAVDISMLSPGRFGGVP